MGFAILRKVVSILMSAIFYKDTVSNSHCLKDMVRRWLLFRQIDILCIFQRFECYTTLINKEQLYTSKIIFSTSLSKSVITYITLIVTEHIK